MHGSSHKIFLAYLGWVKTFPLIYSIRKQSIMFLREGFFKDVCDFGVIESQTESLIYQKRSICKQIESSILTSGLKAQTKFLSVQFYVVKNVLRFSGDIKIGHS